MDTRTGKILFRPICSKCKKLIPEKIDYITYPYKSNGFIGEKGYIQPSRCPFCNTVFEGIEMPTKLPFDYSLRFVRGEEWE